jgi:hypothetical protein
MLQPQCLQVAYASFPPELNALDEQQAPIFAINVFPSFWVGHYSDKQETTRKKNDLLVPDCQHH